LTDNSNLSIYIYEITCALLDGCYFTDAYMITVLLFYFQGIGDSAQGFANFVLYCYCTDSIRRRIKRNLLKMCNKETNITRGNFDTGELSVSSICTTMSSIQGSDRKKLSKLNVSNKIETQMDSKTEGQNNISFIQQTDKL